MNLKTAAFVGVSLLLVFIAGRFTAPTADKELTKKYEQERQLLLEDIKIREDKIQSREKVLTEIIKKMREDEIRDSITLQRNAEEYLKLKKQNEKLNYRNASISKLDSARARYITLYTDQ